MFVVSNRDEEESKQINLPVLQTKTISSCPERDPPTSPKPHTLSNG